MLAIQCGRCNFKTWLDADVSDLSSIPYRVCDEYPDGVPEFVSTLETDKQEDCPKFKEKK